MEIDCGCCNPVEEFGYSPHLRFAFLRDAIAVFGDGITFVVFLRDAIAVFGDGITFAVFLRDAMNRSHAGAWERGRVTSVN